ncbi:MAG: M16 family metallopeptidase [Fimbriimonas sp.]
MSALRKFTLPNGVRVLVEPIGHVQSSAIGLWCRTGSRHEFENEGGITHLIEHMLFKGTETRTAKAIAESIEGRGGALNAFTDKEQTCYYARVLANDTENALDVLSDMMRHSLIEPDELELEKRVVLEEIKRSEDEPESNVHEVHLEHRWGNHPLGRPVIGTRDSVSSFKRDNISAYMDRRYRAENVLLSIAGNVDPEQILAVANHYLGQLPSGSSDVSIERPTGQAGVNLQNKDVEQVHFCIGTDGCSIYDEDLHTLIVLDSALGGSMSSRLFQEIRETRGLVYSIGSYMLNYTAGGTFTVYGGTSPETWEQVQELVQAEFNKVMADGLDEAEILRIKRQIAGHMVLALEGMSARMMRMARNELAHGRDIPVEETLAKIDAVDQTKLIELARRVLAPERISTTAIGQFE